MQKGKLDAATLLTKARVALILKSPFWGSLCLYLRLTPVNPESTGITTTATDYKHLFYNPKWIESLSFDEVKFIIGHEVAHIMFDHLGRRGSRLPLLWNVACVDGDTEILLWNGNRKRIRDLRVGEIVVGFKDGAVPNRILETATKSYNTIYRIHVGGVEITCSSDHRFLTPSGSYVRAEELSIGMSLLLTNAKMGAYGAGKTVHHGELSLYASKRDSRTVEQTIPSYSSSGKQSPITRAAQDEEILQNSCREDGQTQFDSDGLLGWNSGWGRQHLDPSQRTVLQSGFGCVEYRFRPNGLVGRSVQYQEATSEKRDGNSMDQGSSLWIWNQTNSPSIGTISNSEKTTMQPSYAVHRYPLSEVVTRRSKLGDGGDLSASPTPEFTWCRIQGIQSEREERVLYDMATETHNYIANGIVTHNSDYAINSVLINSLVAQDLAKAPSEILYDEKFKGMHAEAIYEKLPKITCPTCGLSFSPMTKEIAKGDGDTGPCGHQITLDKHIEPQGGAGTPQAKELAGEWKRRVAAAAQVAKMQGKLPGGLEELIDDILEPSVNWRSILASFIVKTYKSNFRWNPPSRRYLYTGIIMPSMRSEGLGHVAVTVDTSGSISNDVLKQFLGEVQGILNSYEMKLHVIQHDAKVQKYDVFSRGEAIAGIKIKGRGGTSHEPPFEKLQEIIDEVGDVRCVIVLTDAYTTWPETVPNIPTLIVTTPDHGELPEFPHSHVEIDIRAD